MQLGRVVGTVVSTVKEPRMKELKLQVLRLLDERGKESGAYAVAVDAVGAGHGDVVLFAGGSSARQTGLTDGKPTDATIMAIVDSWDVEGRVVYEASPASEAPPREPPRAGGGTRP
jgi:microcompartment protein CcmK/EutM